MEEQLIIAVPLGWIQLKECRRPAYRNLFVTTKKGNFWLLLDADVSQFALIHDMEQDLSWPITVEKSESVGTDVYEVWYIFIFLIWSVNCSAALFAQLCSQLTCHNRGTVTYIWNELYTLLQELRETIVLYVDSQGFPSYFKTITVEKIPIVSATTSNLRLTSTINK